MSNYRNPLDVAIELPMFDDPRRRYEHSDPATGERCLWLAFLELAATDALGTTGISAVGDSTAEARNFWRRPPMMLRFACAILGYDLEWVRRRMDERIREAERAEDRVYESARRRRQRAERVARMERRFPGYLDRRRTSGYHVD